MYTKYFQHFHAKVYELERQRQVKKRSWVVRL